MRLLLLLAEPTVLRAKTKPASQAAHGPVPTRLALLRLLPQGQCIKILPHAARPLVRV